MKQERIRLDGELASKPVGIAARLLPDRNLIEPAAQTAQVELVLSESLESKRDCLIHEADLLSVNNEATYVEAGGVLLEIKTIRKAITEELRPIRESFSDDKRRADDGIKRVDAFVKQQCDPLLAAESSLASKRLTWDAAERRRREQEAAAREAKLRAEREAEAIARAEAMQANEAPPELIDRVLDEATHNVPSVRVEAPKKTEGLRTVTRWQFEIQDVKAAATWLATNGYFQARHIETLVGGLVRAQKAACAIPGVRCWPEAVEELSGRKMNGY